MGRFRSKTIYLNKYFLENLKQAPRAAVGRRGGRPLHGHAWGVLRREAPRAAVGRRGDRARYLVKWVCFDA